jgi:hypothetical protein
MRYCFPTTMLLSAESNIAARRASGTAECTALLIFACWSPFKTKAKVKAAYG